MSPTARAAAITAQVASRVPPIHAPATGSDIPTALQKYLQTLRTKDKITDGTNIMKGMFVRVSMDITNVLSSAEAFTTGDTATTALLPHTATPFKI